MREVARLVRDGGRECIGWVWGSRCACRGTVSPSVGFTASSLVRGSRWYRRKIESLLLMREVARLVRDGGRDGVGRVWGSRCACRGRSLPRSACVGAFRQREPMIGVAYFSFSRLVLVRFVGGSRRCVFFLNYPAQNKDPCEHFCSQGFWFALC